jgi:hypothetical protein
MLDQSLLSLMEDTVTIEPYVSQTSAQVPTYGTAVTYRAQVLPFSERVISPAGREVRSNVQVIIPERLAIDTRSRLTLPSGFTPNQPPIMAVQPMKALGLDHTRILA